MPSDASVGEGVGGVKRDGEGYSAAAMTRSASFPTEVNNVLTRFASVYKAPETSMVVILPLL